MRTDHVIALRLHDQAFIARFWRNVDVSDDGRCWDWTSCAQSRSRAQRFYGVLRTLHDGKSIGLRAHRVAWAVKNGPIPDGLFVCHHCDNSLCCNPAHLFLGTNQDNVDDRNRKQRQARGSNQGAAKLTEELVRELRIRAQSETRAATAKAFGISEQHVRDIVARRFWKHV